MKTLQELENKLKELEQELKKLKETPEDEKLNYLNKTARSGIKKYWVVKEADGYKEYVARDQLNNKYKYVITGITYSSFWRFEIYKYDGNNESINISWLGIDKNELSFEKFVDYIVYPIVSGIKLGGNK